MSVKVEIALLSAVKLKNGKSNASTFVMACNPFAVFFNDDPSRADNLLILVTNESIPELPDSGATLLILSPIVAIALAITFEPIQIAGDATAAAVNEAAKSPIDNPVPANLPKSTLLILSPIVAIALAIIFEPTQIAGATTAAAVNDAAKLPIANPATANFPKSTLPIVLNTVAIESPIEVIITETPCIDFAITLPNASNAGAARFNANASGISEAPKIAKSTDANKIAGVAAANVADAASIAIANGSIPSVKAVIIIPALRILLHSTVFNPCNALVKSQKSAAKIAKAAAPNNTFVLPNAAIPSATPFNKSPANFGNPRIALPMPLNIPPTLLAPPVGRPGNCPPVGRSGNWLPPVILSSAAPPNFLTSLAIPATPLPAYSIANTAGTTATTVSAIVPVIPPPVIRLVTEFTPFASFSNIHDTASTAGNSTFPIAIASLSNAFPNRAKAAVTLFCTARALAASALACFSFSMSSAVILLRRASMSVACCVCCIHALMVLPASGNCIIRLATF